MSLSEIYQKDIYTGSGSVQLFNCWTENVTKFDTSSFYNWEQDNEPLYDLEERTYLNWEKLGYPTSSIPGLALVVSADAPGASIGCNANIFADVSSCIKSIPKFLDFPVLVEVANYGDLGHLTVDGFTFGPRGSLEIINRNSHRGYSYNVTSDGATWGDIPFINGVGHDASVTSQGYGITSVNNTNDSEWGLYHQIEAASALSISALVASSMSPLDDRFTSNATTLISSPGHYGSNWGLSVMNGSLGFDANIDLTANNSKYAGENYVTLDGSGFNEKGGGLGDTTRIDARSYLSDPSSVSMTYGNHLKSLKVMDCNGPLYIRGFLIDGDREVQDGVIIKNSSLVLEGCASVLNSGNGYLIDNSHVTLTRGCIAHRNYLRDTTDRASGLWGDLAGSEDPTFTDETAGLKAVNSDITISSTSAFEYSIRNDLSSVLPVNDMIEFSRNTNGISLENSVLKGGLSENPNAEGIVGSTSKYTMTNLVSLYNSHNGILSTESTINLNGGLDLYNNMRGMDLHNSNVILDKVVVESSQKQGIRAKQSSILYNKDLNKPNGSESPFNFNYNGQHLELQNSRITPVYADAMPDKYLESRFTNSHGLQASGGTSEKSFPAVTVKDNSYAELMCPFINTLTGETKHNSPMFGSLLLCDNNSEAVLRGTKDVITRLAGVDIAKNLREKIAGVYVNNNSKVEFTGPTVIARLGVDVLADNNSVISFNPPRNKSDGSLATSSFTLDDIKNHTMVELHSFRSCLVADNGSVINMKDLGSFTERYTGSRGAEVITSGLDYDISDIEYSVCGGAMQFFPNPIDSEVNSLDTFVFDGDTVFNQDVGNKFYYLREGNARSWGTTTSDLTALTQGGVCLRALHGSKVDVNNVHFPTTYWNPSGIYFNTTGATHNLCDKLFIWNIAQDSYLNASYLSISGSHPYDLDYHGPSAIWTTGTSGPLYTVPSGTPDTSSLAILDYFGSGYNNCLPIPPNGTSVTGQFGEDDFENKGPFRLYLSPDPIVNILTDATNTHWGLANQLYSQGYHPSGNMTAVADLSSTFGDLVRWDSTNNLTTERFYYASSIMQGGTVNIFLDESAANTFANAKHLAVGKSGLAKKVNIFYPYTAVPEGDSAEDSTKGLGKGYRSSSQFDLERIN